MERNTKIFRSRPKDRAERNDPPYRGSVRSVTGGVTCQVWPLTIFIFSSLNLHLGECRPFSVLKNDKPVIIDSTEKSFLHSSASEYRGLQPSPCLAAQIKASQ